MNTTVPLDILVQTMSLHHARVNKFFVKLSIPPLIWGWGRALVKEGLDARLGHWVIFDQDSSTELESEESSQQEDLEMFSQPQEIVHTVEQVQADLLTMVDGQENKLVYVRNISKFYESCFRRKFPYAMSLLNEALESLDRPLEVWLIPMLQYR